MKKESDKIKKNKNKSKKDEESDLEETIQEEIEDINLDKTVFFDESNPEISKSGKITSILEHSAEGIPRDPRIEREYESAQEKRREEQRVNQLNEVNLSEIYSGKIGEDKDKGVYLLRDTFTGGSTSIFNGPIARPNQLSNESLYDWGGAFDHKINNMEIGRIRTIGEPERRINEGRKISENIGQVNTWEMRSTGKKGRGTYS